MTKVFDIADRLVAQQAEHDPVSATFEGIAGHESELTGYSPDDYAGRAELTRRFHAAMTEAAPSSERDRVSRGVVLERLQREIEWYDENEHLRNLSFAWSPAQSVRTVFNQMQRDTSDQWEDVAARMEQVPDALQSYADTLRAGVDKGVTAGRRQVLAVAEQAAVWSGVADGASPTFAGYVDEYVARPGWHRKLENRLRRAATPADQAFADFSQFLITEYAPVANENDAVGRERYEREAASYLGMRVDAEAIHAWGWVELDRLQREISEVCSAISPGSTRAEVVTLLDDDHERWINGEPALVEWLQALLDRATSKLDGTHFDIPPPLRRLDVKIAPPGGPANQYYVPPSEDLTRPGTYWYPTTSQRKFPMWKEISTAYHEGVPGHHLQCGWVKVLDEELSRFERNLFISGHGEGWALYAERLMDELGFLDRPEYRLDMLFNHLFRAARIVVDIGMHLELTIPEDQGFHPGERWNPDLGFEFMMANSNAEPAFMKSEILRYLGIPGQAISYKVGERTWLDARAAAQQRHGAAFDLKAFHSFALSLGPMGLDQLAEELAHF